LLAIVLTTATFIAQGKLDITLPQASSSAEPPRDPPVELAIDAEERFHYNGEHLTLETLKGRLDDLEPATPITLRVDQGVAFGRFVTVIDALKARSLDKLSIVTREGEA
ncbi:MAG: biopolymer transporter ExbD, partial [Thiohalorhabdus sp.]|uniref:ExbD/TolR family protein n=1 Tax=Thiohalorhabdus sp. TaxID=3094134 RepID=UPI002FC27E53